MRGKFRKAGGKMGQQRVGTDDDKQNGQGIGPQRVAGNKGWIPSTTKTPRDKAGVSSILSL